MLEEVETEGTAFFRGGSNLQPRDGELKIMNGQVQPRRGPSVNTDPTKVAAHGEPHKIESVPEGLTIQQIGKDPGHHEIIPTAPMPKEEFIELLKQIVLFPIQ